jgi:outer membrane protein assembly factor BamB
LIRVPGSIRVYPQSVGGANGELRAFDASDGSERWRVTADERLVV